ncbi:unknown [Paraprevotella clara CAG:116]|nr:unknown [Paraprevotella clara CAG:116]
MPHKATIHDRLPFGVSLSQYGIARLMESRHRTIYLQILIDFAAQFPDRLIRI